MRSEIKILIEKRKRTRGYIKSGWLGAIRDLRKAARERGKKKPRNVQDFSKLAGGGKPARRGFNPTAEIINYATGAREISGAALAHAFSVDAADMRNFAARQLRKRARQFSAA